MTGLLLVLMLAAEGLTITAIHPLLPWHVAIGLALIPPVGLKLGSTLWRFAHYYLGDDRYRRAGPPNPLLRLLGPVVILTTVALLASGVAAWLAGPGDRTLVDVHKASFAIWFLAMTVHVLAHLWRALRLTGADMSERHSKGTAVPYPRLRRGAVLASFAMGVTVAITARGLGAGWSTWSHQVR
jgi:hypothetical protein